MSRAFSLVLETSTPRASIALAGVDGLLEQREFCSDRNHNAMLFEPLSGMMHREIGLVLVGSGPGSYSGTRVGIAAAQGVGIALGCPVVAVPSILAVPSAEGGARCLAIGDARRGSYWNAMMDHSRLTAGPALCGADALAAMVSRAAGEGIPVVSFEDPARFPLPDELVTMVRLEFPDAARLWHVWTATDDESRSSWCAEIPQPLYLKPPHITPGKRPSLLRP